MKLQTHAMRVEMMKANCPPDSVGVEIGVRRGDFAAEILEHVKPSKLFLVDPWGALDASSDPAAHKFPPEIQQANFEFVCERFKGDPRVFIVRGFSPVALNMIIPLLDWGYVDGNHSPGAVLADLNGLLQRLKPDGFIAGHDFTVHYEALERDYFVYDAVQEFLFRHRPEWRLTDVTRERWPSFLLRRTDAKV